MPSGLCSDRDVQESVQHVYDEGEGWDGSDSPARSEPCARWGPRERALDGQTHDVDLEHLPPTAVRLPGF